MKNNEILKKLIFIASNQQKAIHKLAQMGVGVRIKFHHPQYFAKFAKSLFDNAIDSSVNVEIYHDRVTFFDGSGSMSGSELQKIVVQVCSTVEKSLNLDHGELFNYDNLEWA